MDITLPKGFINHQCALHDNVMYACPDWSRGDSCIGIQRDSSALTIAGDFRLNKARFHAAVVSTYRGLMVIGGKTSSTEILVNGNFIPGPRLPIPIGDAGVVQIHKNVYILGGFNYYTNQELSSMLILSEGAQYWAKI